MGLTRCLEKRLGGFEREIPLEHGNRSQQALFGGCEQVVAPGDRVAHRLQSFRNAPLLASQHMQATVEPGEERLRRENGHPGGGQLDRQREAVEAPANFADLNGRRVVQGVGQAAPHVPGR